MRKTSEEVVHFYNARDVDAVIAPPEVAVGINPEERGDLKLTPAEEQAIVFFFKCLPMAIGNMGVGSDYFLIAPYRLKTLLL